MCLNSIVVRMAPHLIHNPFLWCAIHYLEIHTYSSHFFTFSTRCFRLLSQYFDTLAVVGANSLILEHDPQTVANLQNQVRHSFGNGSFGSKDR